MLLPSYTIIDEINLIALSLRIMQKGMCLDLSLERSLTETNLLKQMAPKPRKNDVTEASVLSCCVKHAMLPVLSRI